MQSLQRLKAIALGFTTFTRANQIFNMQSSSFASKCDFPVQGNYFVEDRNGRDNYVILHPKGENDATKHKYSLIWLHGLGDSAYGFLDIFTDEKLNVVPPSCKVILTTAPEREVTCNGGMMSTSWFDIRSLDRSAMNI
jgi:hypothetical protein